MVRGGVLWRVVPAGGEQDPRGDGTYRGDVSGQLEIEVGAATTDEPEYKNSDDQNHHREDRHHRKRDADDWVEVEV